MSIKTNKNLLTGKEASDIFVCNVITSYLLKGSNRPFPFFILSSLQREEGKGVGQRTGQLLALTMPNFLME